MTTSEGIRAWLESLGLGQYAHAFEENSIDWDVLPDVDQDTLKDIGVSRAGDRLRLLKAIRDRGTNQTPQVASNQSIDPKPPASAPAIKAERRQITVMFCDLVGSTQLSDQLDPEDLRRLVNSYHQSVSSVCSRYSGYVAQFLGDGVLVYFGYPSASESDPESAIRAALQIVEAVHRLEPLSGVTLECRVGIATGPVVISEIGTDTPASETGAMGATPNLAARLQSSAEPGTVVVADSTRQLVGNRFDMRSLGHLNLKGLSPTVAWLVDATRESAPKRVLKDAPQSAFVGRAGEMATLDERWDLVVQKQPQTILMTGEAGIGKSRLCQQFIEHLLLRDSSLITIELQCSPFFQASPLYPVREHLREVCDIRNGDTTTSRNEKLRSWVGQTAPDMLGGTALAPLENLLDAGTEEQDNQGIRKSISLLVELLEKLLTNRHLLLLIEDVHWIDSSTQEMLEHAVARLAGEPLMILMTSRAEPAPEWRTSLTPETLLLNALPLGKARELVNAVMHGLPVSSAHIEQIIARSDGVPLYIEEIARAVVEADDRESLPVPMSLQDSLMARLDRLTNTKSVAQIASVIGRNFGWSILLAASGIDPPVLDKSISELTDANLITSRGSGDARIFTFRHALIRDTAYNSMVREHKKSCHHAVATALLTQAADGAPVMDELVAYHWEHAGSYQQALSHWQQAGKRESDRGADREAASHYNQALQCLDKIDDCPDREETRLSLQISLGNCLLNSEGYGSDVTQNFWDNLVENSVNSDDGEGRFRLLMGLSPTLYARGQLQQHLKLFDATDRSFLEAASSDKVLSFHALRTVSLLMTGRPMEAWQSLKTPLTQYEHNKTAEAALLAGALSFVAPMAYAVRILILLGQFAEAKMYLHKNIALTRQSDHPPSLCWAVQSAGDAALLWEDAEELRSAVDEYEPIANAIGLMARVAMASLHRGALYILEGRDIEYGADLAMDGLRQWERAGGIFHCSERALCLADLLVKKNKMDLVKPFLDYAEDIQQRSDERISEAELFRLRGRLALAENRPEAVSLLMQALDTANRSKNVLFAIRAVHDLLQMPTTDATSNGVLRETLRNLLKSTDGGNDFPDLVHARKLLSQI